MTNHDSHAGAEYSFRLLHKMQQSVRARFAWKMVLAIMSARVGQQLVDAGLNDCHKALLAMAARHLLSHEVCHVRYFHQCFGSHSCHQCQQKFCTTWLMLPVLNQYWYII